MAINLRSHRELDLMRRAGKVVAEVLSQLQDSVEPGVSTGRLDRIAIEVATKAGAECLFQGVQGPYSSIPFPGAICASINEQVVHGIPSERVLLREGDILSIDFGAKLAGYCGDAALTVGVGPVPARSAETDGCHAAVARHRRREDGPGHQVEPDRRRDGGLCTQGRFFRGP